ncbi:MAG: IPT/TIG domain-containing protein [candidate division KSB1 bacterium]|nr:IPT/TIG domain-containing protein [candidate division KSB1 bacterium]MDZ7302866.1 IPT/TIG domain-containing protein [candidate division KSB1 bacterium]MDZ7310441.1 IPT/TIG domain-containing protein [candidate division KSB1 bacterium]
MNRINLKHGLALGVGLLLIVLLGCEKFDNPPAVFNPNEQGRPSPVITGVEPAGAAFAGLTEVKLIGDNFSPVLEENVVYFGNKPGEVKSASKTEIKVIPPKLIADALTIKVVVAGALGIAQFSPYKLKDVSSEYGNFGNLDQVYAIALDANENLYAHLKAGSVVVKVSPAGAKTEFGKASFPQALEMHIGPGGYLYLHRSLGNLFRIGPGGGDAQLFSTLPVRTATFDFDANGNILAAGNKSGIYVVDPNGTPTSTGKFLAFDVKSLRVFNGFVYVLALYTGTDPSIPKSGIWRSQILSASTLGNEELVFDWSKSGDFAKAKFFAMTFSQDGEIYVGTNNADAILLIRPDGSSQALYKGLINPDATHLVWGNGDFLYQNRGSDKPENRRVIRIDMGKKGAPYYGRK